MADTFDYVIVGSGAAGSVLASRLTEDPSVTVCVLECGPPDRHPYIHIPAGFIKMLFNPTYTWQFQTEPGEGINGRQHPHNSGADARWVKLHQRHDLQSRPAGGFRPLGAARQSRLGLCRHSALFQARRTASRSRRRPDSRAPGQSAGHRQRLASSCHGGVYRRRPGTRYAALRRLQQRRQPDGRRLLPAPDSPRLSPFRRSGFSASGACERPVGRADRCSRRAHPVRRHPGDRGALRARSRSLGKPRGGCAQGGDRVLRHRQHREAAADVGRRTGLVAERSGCAGGRRSAGGREFPGPLLDARRCPREERPHDE